jgi:hypothetical protein
VKGWQGYVGRADLVTRGIRPITPRLLGGDPRERADNWNSVMRARHVE